MNEVFFAVWVLVASVLFWWLRKTFTFWKDKGIVHLGFWEYMRFCYKIYTKPLNEVEISYYEKYGRVYGSYQGTDPTLVVGDPDILREIMVSQFKNFSDRSEAQRVGSELWRKSILNLSGDEWSKTRRIFLPALNPIRLRKIALKVKATAEKAVSKVVEAVTQETPLNISELAEHSSLCSTIALNYSVDLENADKDHPLLKSLDAISITLAGWKLVMLFMMPKIYRLLQPDYPKEAESNLFKTFVSHLMEERKSKNKKEDDFLQVFMDAEYDWQNGTDGKGDNAEKQKMSLEAITAQGLIFFVAGVEGAASAVTHTAYLLATHPEYQDKVIAEVDKAISEGGLTYDALQEMPYLEASIKEAMRLATPDSVWVHKTFSFWKGKGIVHLGFWEYMRFCYDIYTKPLNEVIIRYYAKYGRVYGSYQGTVPTVVVGDPEMLREILVSQFKNFSDRSESQRIGSDLWKKSILNLSGDEWKKARSAFVPSLNPAKLKKITLKVRATVENAVSKVMELAARDKPVNITELAEHTALCSTAALTYSVDLENADKDHPLLKSLDAVSMNMGGWKLIMLFLMPNIYKLLQPEYPQESGTNLFKAFVSHLIEDRKSKKKEEEDFLQVFMDAEYALQNGTDGKSDKAEKRKMTLDEITAQGLSFFVAGVEGVATPVTHTAYFLAMHPEAQDRVIAEVGKATTEGGLTYDALQEMPFLEACIKEAIRLTTPDSILLRLCTEETTISGIHFKPGMCVDIPIAAMHRDPEFFPEPEKFNPERFLPENKDSVKPFTYIPFGAGPRNCVGMRLGLLQVKITLAGLLSRVRLEPCPETMVSLKYKPCQIIPVIDGPVILRAVPLDSTSPKKESLTS